MFLLFGGVVSVSLLLIWNFLLGFVRGFFLLAHIIILVTVAVVNEGVRVIVSILLLFRLMILLLLHWLLISLMILLLWVLLLLWLRVLLLLWLRLLLLTFVTNQVAIVPPHVILYFVVAVEALALLTVVAALLFTISVDTSNHFGGPVFWLTSVATVAALATVAAPLLRHLLHMLTVPVLDLWHKLAIAAAPTEASAVVLALRDAEIRPVPSWILGPAGLLSVLGPAGLLTVAASTGLLTVVASRVSAIRRRTRWTSFVIVRRRIPLVLGSTTERLEPLIEVV